jgi:hypothetical protein
MIKRNQTITLVVTFAGLFLGHAALGQQAGKVVRAKGEVLVLSAAGGSQALEKGSAVSVGDSVKTGENGQALIQMEDKSRLIIRKNSEVKIEAFEYKKKDTDKAETSLISGALRAVSGNIAKKNPASVKYSAGTATIGIRGTDIEVAFVGDGERDRAGIYNYVYDGATHMKLASGEEADIAKEKSGFVPKDLKPGEAKLQVLDTRPAFIQGSAFDTLIQQLTNPRLPSFR